LCVELKLELGLHLPMNIMEDKIATETKKSVNPGLDLFNYHDAKVPKGDENMTQYNNEQQSIKGGVEKKSTEESTNEIENAKPKLEDINLPRPLEEPITSPNISPNNRVTVGKCSFDFFFFFIKLLLMNFEKKLILFRFCKKSHHQSQKVTFFV
jgi:hypothetical protein